MSASRSITLRAPAKINWTLEVLGKRDDGWHQVDTLMQAVSLHDELTFGRLKPVACKIHCEMPGIPRGKDNLIWRAWELMRGEFPARVGGLQVQLTKLIPAGAGLGGGSSDAAATLVGINRLYDLRLRKIHLAELGGRLGSDIPFFVYGGTARAQGRGEIITPIASKLPPIHLVIVYPGFPSPTADAYRVLKARKYEAGKKGIALTHQACREAARGNRAGFVARLMNSFDVALPPKDSRYRLLKKHMTETGAKKIMLSGSGSACLGICESAAHARAVVHKLRQFYPASFSARTIRGGMAG